MAAFGFGVGDIIMLTNVIISTIEDIHDAPTELQEIAERVESVEASLESVGEVPYNAAAGSLRNMARLKERVKEVLGKIHDIVIKYRGSNGQVKALNRVKFGVWDKHQVGELLVRLGQRTDNLTNFLIMQTWGLTNQIRPLIDQILEGTRRELDHAKDKSPAKDASIAHRPSSPKGTDVQPIVSDQIDQVQAVLENVLQTERSSDPTSLLAQEDVSVERELEMQLKQAGIGAKFTKALIEVINKQRKQLAHPEDIDPISYTGGRNRLEVPKGWIMVVDSYNEGIPNIPTLALNASLILLKYGQLSPKPISSLSGFGRSTTAANGSSITLSQQVFKLRPSSLGGL